MKTSAYLGPPGTGKTHTLINIVKDALSQGTPPERIGFVSFSKKATEEARTRASRELALDYKKMVHFRTLHSLAFRQLGLKTEAVMRSFDYQRLETELGLPFSSTQSMNINDGEFFRIGGKGDMYLSIYNMARVRKVSLQEQFNLANNWNLQSIELDHVVRTYAAYKQALEKIDFVDMIEMFISQGEAPELDLLIVDEAQDLVPLQWDMVDKLKDNSQQIYYAGDDDQAIYEWMGVDASEFVQRCNSADEAVVLDQSFRVPSSVHEEATRMIKYVQGRIDKRWNPREDQGNVSYHYKIDELPLEEGQWMILARTNYIANRIAADLKSNGYLFWRNGNGWSVAKSTLDVVRGFTKLTRGQEIDRDELSQVWRKIKVDRKIRTAGNKTLKASENEVFDIEFLESLVQRPLQDKKWFEVLEVSDQERIYITSVLESGEKFNDENPRLVLSTIHKAKGGEADNVALLLESTKACCTLSEPDAERRVFYVGATRAKRKLFVVDNPEARWRFQL